MKLNLGYRTDFAQEKTENYDNKNKIMIEHHDSKYIKIQRINVLDNDNELEMKKGHYVTIAYEHLQDHIIRENVMNCLSDELNNIINENVDKIDKCLVVGLGNRYITSDALGNEVCRRIIVTSHLFKHNLIKDEGICNVSCIACGVMGQTGIETSDLIKSVAHCSKPNLVIVIDALATKNIERINRMIQISDVGIEPGSGVNNERKAIDQESLHCPVIVIGVATVVDIFSICKDIFMKVYEENKLNIDEEQINMMIDHMEYTNIDNMIVTVKEMDEDLNHLSEIIAKGINNTLHQNIDLI